MLKAFMPEIKYANMMDSQDIMANIQAIAKLEGQIGHLVVLASA